MEWLIGEGLSAIVLTLCSIKPMPYIKAREPYKVVLKVSLETPKELDEQFGIRMHSSDRPAD